MIVERFALGMAKNLNLSVDIAFSEGLNGTFKTNGREEREESNHRFHRCPQIKKENKRSEIKYKTSYLWKSVSSVVKNLKLLFGFKLTLDLSRNNAKLSGFYGAQRSKIPMQRLVKRIELYGKCLSIELN